MFIIFTYLLFLNFKKITKKLFWKFGLGEEEGDEKARKKAKPKGNLVYLVFIPAF